MRAGGYRRRNSPGYSRNRKNNGVGLGLSLCADIAGIHEAEIKLASRVGKGTLVTVRFPCYKEVTKVM